MPSEQIHLRTYVSPEVRKKLRVIAAQEEMTIAELLRRGVEVYLKQKGIEIDMDEGLEQHGGKRGGSGRPKTEGNDSE